MKKSSHLISLLESHPTSFLGSYDCFSIQSHSLTSLLFYSLLFSSLLFLSLSLLSPLLFLNHHILSCFVHEGNWKMNGTTALCKSLVNHLNDGKWNSDQTGKPKKAFSFLLENERMDLK